METGVHSGVCHRSRGPDGTVSPPGLGTGTELVESCSGEEHKQKGEGKKGKMAGGDLKKGRWVLVWVQVCGVESGLTGLRGGIPEERSPKPARTWRGGEVTDYCELASGRIRGNEHRLPGEKAADGFFIREKGNFGFIGLII